MDCEKISKDFEAIGISIIERTKFGTGINPGMGGKMSDKRRDIKKRVDRISLRVGIEFLVKAVYVKYGYNIYCLADGVSGVNKFDLIESIGETNLKLDRTISFRRLIQHLIDIPIVSNELIEEIGVHMENIEEAGNPAVHSNELVERDLSQVNLVRSRLISLLNPSE